MSTQTTVTGIQIGRSNVIHMSSSFGGTVCNADGNNPGQRARVTTVEPNCTRCLKRAASASARGFQS